MKKITDLAVAIFEGKREIFNQLEEDQLEMAVSRPMLVFQNHVWFFEVDATKEEVRDSFTEDMLDEACREADSEFNQFLDDNYEIENTDWREAFEAQFKFENFKE